MVRERERERERETLCCRFHLNVYVHTWAEERFMHHSNWPNSSGMCNNSANRYNSISLSTPLSIYLSIYAIAVPILSFSISVSPKRIGFTGATACMMVPVCVRVSVGVCLCVCVCVCVCLCVCMMVYIFPFLTLSVCTWMRTCRCANGLMAITQRSRRHHRLPRPSVLTRPS
jgi:hypothetical protein